MAHPIAVLEVGTFEVRVLVAEPREDGHLMITGIGRTPSSGVRKGEIVDLANARTCVKSALRDAEDQAQVSIEEVMLVFSGDHIRQLVNRGTVNLYSDSEIITSDERNEVMEIARAVNIPHDHEVLHAIPGQYYINDDPDGVVNPDGMTGTRLSMDMLILYGRSNHIGNLYSLGDEAGVEISDVAFGGFCSGLSALSPQQKEVGGILIDLGAGTTDYVVYANKLIIAAGSLGVGGDHVTNDLAVGLNLSTNQAERLKVNYGAAMIDLGTRGRRLSIPPESGFRAQEVLSRDVNTIIHARMEEMFDLVKKRIDTEIQKRNFGAGVIITGGGARMNRVRDLASRVFEMPCHLGVPKDVSGLAMPSESPEYAAVVGMLKLGWRNRDPGDRAGLSGLLRRVFRK